jgi:flagellar basal body-associated protein FliL
MQSTVIPPNGNSKFKKLLPIVLIVIAVLVCIGIGIYLFANSNKKVEQTSAEKADPLLVTVGKYEIRESTLWTQARLEYVQEAIDKTVLQKYLDSQIERRILDLEAEKNSIEVSDTEVQSRLGNNDSQAVKNTIYYDLIKNKIMATQTHNVEAFVIGFYIASYEYPQKPEYAVQRSDGTEALEEIETRMSAGESPLEITKSIYEKYPSLKDILALNSLLYKSPTNEENYLNPKLIQVNTMDPTGPSFDPVYFSVVSTIQKGEVRKGERTAEGSGGFVMKAVEVNKEGFPTYEEFLSAKKKEYVTVVNTL